ncbi:MAG TPA: hypothetical protein VNS32_19985 [Flavisolibacter sp.]|nr:hypothetical protein [Flavisolibacter sp.]
MTEITEHNVIQHLLQPQPEIRNCIIVGNVLHTFESGMNKKVVIEGCEFRGQLRIETSHNSFSFEINNCGFADEVSFESIMGQTSIRIHNCAIRGGLQIEGSFNELKLNHSQLSGTIMLSGSAGSVECISSAFDTSQQNQFLFNDFQVGSVASFYKSCLHNAFFKKSRFGATAIFDGCIFTNDMGRTNQNFCDINFSSDAYFNGAEFSDQAFFNGSNFYGLAIFSNNNLKATPHFDFSGAIFQKRTVFDGSRYSQLVLKHSEFHDLVSFKDIKVDKLIISKALFAQGADFLGARVTSGDRETFRIIKNEFLKINNQVEALQFKAKEMIAYEDELKNAKNWGDYALVSLNKLSNKHGLSWTRGLFFTTLVALLFYLFYLWTLKSLPFQFGWKNCESFSQASGMTIKYFIRFLIITHDIDFMAEFGPTAASFIVDFIAKIFIGYGIYQTVQAFRKHGKL